MADNNALIAVSAFSGLFGAILTQGINGIISYFSDKRKFNNETKASYRSRKMEIGENFYYITSEKLSIIKTHIEYWKKREATRTETSLAFMNREMKKLNAHMERLNSDNWKFNLINLYFDVSLSVNEVIEGNAVSQSHYVKFLDAIDQIKNARDEERKPELYAAYAQILFNMCSHYEDLCIKLENDIALVKAELLKEFNVTG